MRWHITLDDAQTFARRCQQFDASAACGMVQGVPSERVGKCPIERALRLSPPGAVCRRCQWVNLGEAYEQGHPVIRKAVALITADERWGAVDVRRGRQGSMKHVWDTRRPKPPLGYEVARCMRCGVAEVSTADGRIVYVQPYSHNELEAPPACVDKRERSR